MKPTDIGFEQFKQLAYPDPERVKMKSAYLTLSEESLTMN